MVLDFYNGHIYNKKDIWTDQFIEEYKEEIDWTKLLKKVMLTEEQIEKYSDYIIWKNVFLYQQVSEQFIEKYIDKLENFDWVCAHRDLSIEFVEKYKNRIHWNFIAQNNLSKKFLYAFSGYINWTLFTLQHCYDWDEDFMREFVDKIDWQMLLGRKKLSNNFKRELAFFLDLKKNSKDQMMRWIGCTMKDEDWKEWANNIDDKQGRLEKTLHYNHALSDDLIIANTFLFSAKYLKGRYNRTKKLNTLLDLHPEIFNDNYE